MNSMFSKIHKVEPKNEYRFTVEQNHCLFLGIKNVQNKLAPLYFRTSHLDEVKGQADMELCWSYTNPYPIVADCEQHLKVNNGFCRIAPFGKSVFTNEELYIGIYFWKATSLSIGISFGVDFFNKGQLMNSGGTRKNVSIKAKIEMKQAERRE